MVFMKSKHILPKNMIYTINEYFFICLPMTKEKKYITNKIVLSIYNDNMQIRKESDLSAFYKVNTLLLWFLNMISCRKRLVFACFTNDFMFGNLISDISCYDNYFYSLYEGVNAGENSDVSD